MYKKPNANRWSPMFGIKSALSLAAIVAALKFFNITDLEMLVVKLSVLLPYLGLILCFGLSAFGTIKGMKTIANSVSGGSILVPRIGSKSCFGIIFCEANFLCGILMTFMLLGFLPLDIEDKAVFLSKSYVIFACGAIVGVCTYYSSISTGIICSAICIMDAKDPTLFMKLVVLELFSSSIGILGFVMGVILQEKISSIS